MKIKSYAVKVKIIACKLIAFLSGSGAVDGLLDFSELLSDAADQGKVLLFHSSTPSLSIALRKDARQSSGSTRSTLNFSLRPVTAPTAA